jgi:hypothetical protein
MYSQSAVLSCDQFPTSPKQNDEQKRKISTKQLCPSLTKINTSSGTTMTMQNYLRAKLRIKAGRLDFLAY